MTGISTGVKIFYRETEYGEVKDVLTYNLLEFVAWLERAKARGAKVMPNGMTGAIVTLDNGAYFDVEVM